MLVFKVVEVEWMLVVPEIDPDLCEVEWMLVVPEIDPDLCEGCGRCVVECPGKAVDLVDGKAKVARPEDCSYCAECETICRSGAIQ